MFEIGILIIKRCILNEENTPFYYKIIIVLHNLYSVHNA